MQIAYKPINQPRSFQFRRLVSPCWRPTMLEAHHFHCTPPCLFSLRLKDIYLIAAVSSALSNIKSLLVIA